MSQEHSSIEVITYSYFEKVKRTLVLTPELDGKTLRQILSQLYSDKNILMIDIHDGSWHEEVCPAIVLDTTYNHFGPSFRESKHSSINYADILSASCISSAGGLRVLAR